MSPRFDFKCEKCSTIREDVWVSNFRDVSGTFTGGMIGPCACGGILEKMPAAPNFSVKGYSAKNHYGVKNETK